MKFLFLFLFFWVTFILNAQNAKTNNTIEPGAYQLHKYIPLLYGKRVGVFANHTSVIANTHIVDSLQKSGVNIVKIFSPEHGFRGDVDAGAKVDNSIDAKSGLPVISLYGKKQKPTAEDLQDVDILLFDLQDVGTRFYTYISSLQDFMEAAIDNNKPLIILDRPNPNGFYVDGPILNKSFKSYVGMQPVPVVYGMTIGEYALMLYKEKWLIVKNETASKKWKLKVIKCTNYTHDSLYKLPVKPSPNLPDMASIYRYPSTCLFEGTCLSEGRGTAHPFCIFGHPSLPDHLYSFTPQSKSGAADPKLKDKLCYGFNLHGNDADVLKCVNKQIQLHWLLETYRLFTDKENYFIKPKSNNPENYFFNKLAGNEKLMQQIIAGKTAEEIKASWQPELQKFKKVRKKYLLYKDFE